MESERRQVLEMLAEGKVTVEEAQQLLDALNQASVKDETIELPVKRAGLFKKPRMIYIDVVENGKKKVNVRIPLSLAKLGMRFVPEDAVNVAGEKINLDEVFDAIKNGVEGNLVEVDADDKQVRIYVK